jgi:signal peptide peptidase SppA
MMASAAYWIGSAADQVYIGADTAAVGSIGVVASHTDYSRREEMLGIKTTEIYAGKYKRIASEHQPLSADGREYMQETVDYLYSVFVGEVAKQRGSDPETVHQNMADGRIFTGQQAVSAGLVDGVSTLDQLIADMGASQIAERQRAAALRALNATLKTGAGVAPEPKP